jgi:hypothetical protein
LCKRGISTRIYAYYPVSGESGGPGILELTQHAENSLFSQMGAYFEKPEGFLIASRKAGKRNNPVHVNWKLELPAKWTAGQSMTKFKLGQSLFRIWGLPLKEEGETDCEFYARTEEVIRLRTTKNP